MFSPRRCSVSTTAYSGDTACLLWIVFVRVVEFAEKSGPPG